VGVSRDSSLQGQGAGFFINGDGYIVTNNHVVD
jgi:S1-C subfamily serine protease